MISLFSYWFRNLVLLNIILGLASCEPISVISGSVTKSAGSSNGENSRCSLESMASSEVSFEEILSKIPIRRTPRTALGFHEGWTRIYNPNDIQVAYADRTGRVIVRFSPELEANSAFSEGLVPVATLNRYPKKIGFVDKTGKFVIHPQYGGSESWFYKFIGGVSVAHLNGKSGFIDRTGKWIIPPHFEFAKGFSEGLAPIKLKGKWGFVNLAGQIVIPPRFQEPRFTVDIDLFKFSEGLASVLIDKKIGYIDATDRMVIPPQFDEGGKFSEGVAAVKIGNKRGYINPLGKIVILPKFHVAREFSEGLAAVIVDSSPESKYGFIDAIGQMVIPPKFDYAEKFSEGFAAVRINGRWGFIDSSGDVAIPPLFSSVSSFSEGVAAVNFDASGKIRGGYITRWELTRWLQKCNSHK